MSLRIAVLGGTGRTGRAIVTVAAESGHVPVRMARSADPEREEAGIEARPVDVMDARSVLDALADVDAVVTALSIPRTSRSPFAALTGPPDLHSVSTRHILEAMRAHGLRRWVKLSAQGVGDSAPRAGWAFRLLVATSNLRPAFEDHARADALLAQTDLDWTVVRPPILSAPGTGRVRADPAGVTWTTTRIPLTDVARWVVDAVTDTTTYRSTVTLLPA